MTCIFCKIVNREAPAEMIYEDEDVMAFYGLHSSAPIHALVIPKKHIENIMDIKVGDERMIYNIHHGLQEVAKILGISSDGFRVITNTGKHGQQEIYHLHYHIIGGRQLKWEM
ncbi:HIT domain-containing protein [Halalkalibacter sp. APA_J-10(15)]|uniref:HIT domain-containing protein n=1 Tax=Halalkalibacter sp. APA_J-10(15) TaxID=2933805 RepID=UPI001FF1767F|nr:HIT domain-containing protein [Halalkalibacter sp. APA_J-10(15)]MCK0473247.1 HIT domain-containing protein [Halalkalibacter sp. APA_J-10(15)]